MIVRSARKHLASVGAVGGIDIGWSETKASSAVARLDWDTNCVNLTVSRFRAIEPERTDTISKVLERQLLAVALDGPLNTGLQPVTRYRYAERLLTLGFQPLIGKPGQGSSLNGRKLNEYATYCARMLVSSGFLERADHPEQIHALAVVEAFPTAFLGVLLENPKGLRTKKPSLSDIFFEALSKNGLLSAFIDRLLPGREQKFDLAMVRNHDDRAAIICAITALCVAAGEYTAVGDKDGWIILPPVDLLQPWALHTMECNYRFLSESGIVPLAGRRLGLLAGMHPDVSLEDFNAQDAEIAAMFHEGGAGIEP